MDVQNVTLDDIIKLRQEADAVGMHDLIKLPLNEVIKVLKSRGLMKKGVPEDKEVLKSLDEIVGEKNVTSSHVVKMTHLNEEEINKQPIFQSPMLLQNPVPSTQKPVKKFLLRQIDPCTNALDDIIEEVEEEEIPEVPGVIMSQHNANKRKLESCDPAALKTDVAVTRQHAVQQFHNTPYRAVGFLSETGMIIEIVIGRLNNDGSGDKSHLWRCIVTCGAIKGIADSVRKVVAREMASTQFLQQIGQMYKDCEIPRYEVPDELFIDPRIFHQLEKEAGNRCLDLSHEMRVRPVAPLISGNKSRHPVYIFVSTYFVGKEIFKGENFVLEYAKLVAAQKAYCHITSKVARPTEYFTGADCDPSFEYNFSESEVYQTVGRLENADQRGIPEDIDEAKREIARRELADQFKKSKTEEVEQRRNMPVSVGKHVPAILQGSSTEDTNVETPSKINEQVKPSASPKKGKFRGREKMIEKIARELASAESME